MFFADQCYIKDPTVCITWKYTYCAVFLKELSGKVS